METAITFSSRKYTPHFKAYSLADISLDPYPFSGMSIAIETALMGVPTVTLIGDGMQSRGAGRINHIIGLDELNAACGDEYIKIKPTKEYLDIVSKDIEVYYNNV